jgi:hypothetical protein
MPYPNIGDYKGQIGLSSPATYPSTMGYKANEGNMQLRQQVYANRYYSSVGQELPSLLGALY